MGGFVKVVSIIAAVFLGVGALISGVGFFLGGGLVLRDAGGAIKLISDIDEGFDDFSSGFKHLKVSRNGIVFTDKSKNEDGSFFDDNEEVYSYDAGMIEDMEIAAGAAYLTVEVRDDKQDTVDIEYHGAGHLTCELENGTLKCGNEDDSTDIPLFSLGKMDLRQIKIKVPADLKLDSMKLMVGAGEADIDRIDAKKADIKIGAGSVSVKDIISEEMKIELGAGRFEVTGQTISDEVEMAISAGEGVIRDLKTDSLELEMAMGNADITADDIIKDIDARVAMGNITFDLAGKKEDYDFDIEASLGSVYIDGKSYDGVGIEKKIDNGSGNAFKLKCEAGNVEVSFK